MKGRFDDSRVRIEVPDAVSAFRLERRLAGLHPVSVGRGPRWEVDIERIGDDTDSIAEAVRAWLADAGLAHTTVWIDGAPREVESRS